MGDETKRLWELLDERDDVDAQIDEYLRAAGWRKTGGEDGRWWRWELEAEDAHYICDRENAIRAQRAREVVARGRNLAAKTGGVLA